jgi:serine/threonine protein kinase
VLLLVERLECPLTRGVCFFLQSSPAQVQLSGALPGLADLQGPWLLDHEELRFGALVDESSFTEVYRGQYRDHDVAIKKLIVHAWGETLLEEVARQARLRCRLMHPNINSFLGFTEFPSLCLVSGWAPNGSLEELLARVKPAKSLPPLAGLALMRDVACGVAYLHSQRPGLVHRAISTRKVLLSGQLQGIISDFTLSASLEEEGVDFRRTVKVVDPPRMMRPPAPWAAPEVREGRELRLKKWGKRLFVNREKKIRYGPSCDVYSWGMVAQAVFDVCFEEVGMKDLVEQCVRVRAEERPGSDSVVAACEERLRHVREGGAQKSALQALDWPKDDEECSRRFGVYRREELPGDTATDGWLVAPKFKLAYDDLDIGDMVAEGGFSEIYRGSYKGRSVAIKKLKTWLLGEDTLLEFQKEAEVLASLFHPNILVMVGITVFPSLCIVTPWAERGSLDRYLYHHENPLSVSLACKIQRGIARGALYLHSVHILHRDIVR